MSVRKTILPSILAGFSMVALAACSSAPTPNQAAEPVPKVVEQEVPRTRTLPGIESPAFPYAQPEEVGLSTEKLDRLGYEIVEWVANGDFVGGELLIIKDGKAVFHEAYGWSDRERKIPVERDSIWSIKSMSKPFTAMAVLMLEEAGKLLIDDPVSRYIAGFAGDERTTIRHLLSHTSGFRSLELVGAHDSLSDWVEDWASRGPTGTFGQYEYTDFGFGAAGYVVKSVSGLSIETFTEERIIGPLQLHDTSTAYLDDPAWRSRVNEWYRWNEDALRYDPQYNWPWWSFYPAAWGIFSTAMDYAEFMGMWMNGGEWEGVRLLSAQTVDEALDPHALIGGNLAYGYGWFLEQTSGDEGMPSVFYHGGGDGTLAIAFPEANAVVIFLTHSRGGSHLRALRNRLAMSGLFEHPGFSLVWADEAGLETVELSPEERARYVGMYRGRAPGGAEAPEFVGHVWEESGHLHSRFGVLGIATDMYIHLAPIGDHRFVHARYGGDHLEAVGTVVKTTFEVEEGEATGYTIFVGDELLASLERADPAKVRADAEAERKRVSIDEVVLERLEAEGSEAARAFHRDLLASRPESVRLGEGILNALGYRLLRQERVADAIAVFEMNVEAYPQAANPYDSLADAYRAAGRLEDARRNYERAVELAEQQEHESLAAYRGKLESVTLQLEGKQ